MDNRDVPDSDFDHADFVGPDMFEHLKIPSNGLCWWCESAAAATGEHKFKRSDLARLMGGESSLYWGDGGRLREVRGRSGLDRDRHKVIKFPKSMCQKCNNARSQPFDLAYDRYAAYVSTHRFLRFMPGINFHQIFGSDWAGPTLDLGRYYAKHCACRIARTGLPMPPSLRDFLDGASDMPDGHLALITTDSVRRAYGGGLSISPDCATTDPSMSHFRSYVLAAYVGAIGVRYEWVANGIPDERRSQFFHFPNPLLNHFRDERAVFDGETDPQPLLACVLQRLSQPRMTG